MHEIQKKAFAAAVEARTHAYAPYSKYQVGACLFTEEGKFFCGCNVENASYPAGCCAERGAISCAVAAGERTFAGIVIVGGRVNSSLEICPPCGICRQVLAEFCDPAQFSVILAKSLAEYEVYSLQELLPHGFYLKKY